MPLTVNDVKNLLIIAHQYDQRHEVTEVKIASWHAIFREEAPAMDYEWARRVIQRHYAVIGDMLMPNHLIRQWRSQRSDKAVIDAHCGRPGCICTHDCYRGWLDHLDGQGRHIRTSPCPTCRPELMTVLQTLPVPGSRGAQAGLRRGP